jgi:hypothetical protein
MTPAPRPSPTRLTRSHHIRPTPPSPLVGEGWGEGVSPTCATPSGRAPSPPHAPLVGVGQGEAAFPTLGPGV